jgi:dTDP-4-amino-4,6-dideoxygalactose transaminase
MVGSCAHSDFCVFSFHPVKTIAMGEGGAVTCQTSDAAETLMHMRSHGITRDPSAFSNRSLSGLGERDEANPWYYELQDLGYNYRASDIHCALAQSQLKKLDRFLDKRRRLMALYESALSDLAPVVRPISRMPNVSVGWHLNVVLIDFEKVGVSRRDLMDGLRARGIGSQVHYIPLHRQPYYTDLYGDTELVGADRYYDQCLSLPLSIAMAEGDVARVVDALKAELRL